MNKHCKNCKYHYIAGHPKESPLAKNYNNWCNKFSKTTRLAIGQCKLLNGKEL